MPSRAASLFISTAIENSIPDAPTPFVLTYSNGYLKNGNAKRPVNLSFYFFFLPFELGCSLPRRLALLRRVRVCYLINIGPR